MRNKGVVGGNKERNKDKANTEEQRRTVRTEVTVCDCPMRTHDLTSFTCVMAARLRVCLTGPAMRHFRFCSSRIGSQQDQLILLLNVKGNSGALTDL